MSLYENWIRSSYDNQGRSLKSFWNIYMPKEQAIYEDIIGNKIEAIEMPLNALAEKYNMQDYEIVGFIDGINGGLKEEINVEELENTSDIKLEIDFEALYKKMVEYKAEHLYTLSQWDNIFDEETRKRLTHDQRISGIIVKGHKTGRNDPCPCGSGKKFKQCCGK